MFGKQASKRGMKYWENWTLLLIKSVFCSIFFYFHYFFKNKYIINLMSKSFPDVFKCYLLWLIWEGKQKEANVQRLLKISAQIKYFNDVTLKEKMLKENWKKRAWKSYSSDSKNLQFLLLRKNACRDGSNLIQTWQVRTKSWICVCAQLHRAFDSGWSWSRLSYE